MMKTLVVLSATFIIANGFTLHPSVITPSKYVQDKQFLLMNRNSSWRNNINMIRSFDNAENQPRIRKQTKHGYKALCKSSITIALLTIASSSVANAAKKTVQTSASSSIVLPTTQSLVLACLLPTLLGFYKSEYGVSYGYGTAMAASSILVLSSIAKASGSSLLVGPVALSTILPSISTFMINLKSLSSSLPGFHAASLLFYGTRLNLFLLYRELFLRRFREMRELIEDRAKKQGSRLKRAPFIASCAFLYYCMMCPLLVTSQVCNGLPMTTGSSQFSFLEQAIRVFVGLTLSGFILGAIGDLNKSIGKMMKGEEALITGGVFRVMRHPNYTGEIVGWVSNCLASFAAVSWKATQGEGGLMVWKCQAPHLIMSAIGALGITFVLRTATAGLENRQAEKYGDTEEYKTWVRKSWIGFTAGRKKSESTNVEQNEVE